MMRFCSFSNSNSKLIKNARDGNLVGVRDLLQRGVEVNAKNKYCEAALVRASSYGHAEVVRALLNGEGVDVNIKDAYGGTALYYASDKGHLEVVRALLNHEGVDVNIKDNDGDTALIMASWNGHVEVARALLNHEGICVNIKDNVGGTALNYASEFGHLEVVHALLNHDGVDVNIKDNDDRTALIMASMKGNLEVVHALLNHEGVDVNVRDKYGYTALVFARTNSKSGVARLLEEHMERENLLVVNNPAGSGSKFRLTCYPPRRNVNSPLSDDAKIEQDEDKRLNVMDTVSAVPVELSDARKKRNAEEVWSPREEYERNRKIDAEIKQVMEGKRRQLEWFNRTAESGATQRLTADPRRRNDNALYTMTPTLNKTETSFSK
jgi:ankyrin repeat protein